jgi:hypothetical protein
MTAFGSTNTWKTASLMRAHITRANLLTAINRMNQVAADAGFTGRFSSQVENYSLTAISIPQEIKPEDSLTVTGEVSFGFSFHDLAAYRYQQP